MARTGARTASCGGRPLFTAGTTSIFVRVSTTRTMALMLAFASFHEDFANLIGVVPLMPKLAWGKFIRRGGTTTILTNTMFHTGAYNSNRCKAEQEDKQGKAKEREKSGYAHKERKILWRV